jgi:hypothetical protein
MGKNLLLQLMLLLMLLVTTSTPTWGEVPFKSPQAAIKKSSIAGTYMTETESEWNADVELLKSGKLKIKVIGYHENGKKSENSRVGTWNITKDQVVLKFDKGWVHYKFSPANDVEWIKEKVDVLNPVSSSKNNLLGSQVLYRRPFTRKGDRI